MKTRIALLAAIAMTFTSLSLSAQGAEPHEAKTKFSIEIDPATFVFKGYSAHLRIQPKNSEHVLWGAGFYAMDMPSVFVNFNGDNKNKGWDVRLNRGYGLFGEHHFSEVNRKWFVGAQTGIQEYKIENDHRQGSEKFSNVLLMGYAGYTFQPFDFPFYVKTWAGIGYTSKISGENRLENLEYDISPTTMFATLHLGYTF